MHGRGKKLTDNKILSLLKMQITDTDYHNILSRVEEYDLEIIDRKKITQFISFLHLILAQMSTILFSV